jgi:hypothetical protein
MGGIDVSPGTIANVLQAGWDNQEVIGEGIAAIWKALTGWLQDDPQSAVTQQTPAAMRVVNEMLNAGLDPDNYEKRINAAYAASALTEAQQLQANLMFGEPDQVSPGFVRLPSGATDMAQLIFGSLTGGSSVSENDLPLWSYSANNPLSSFRDGNDQLLERLSAIPIGGGEYNFNNASTAIGLKSSSIFAPSLSAGIVKSNDDGPNQRSLSLNGSVGYSFQTNDLNYSLGASMTVSKENSFSLTFGADLSSSNENLKKIHAKVVARW